MPPLDEIRRHHKAILERLEKETMSILTDSAAQPKDMVSFLRQELLPHAAGEESALYPAVEPLIKAHGHATATMSVDHEVIATLVREIERAVTEVKASSERARSQAQERLKMLALQLQAILRLHLDKEERIYLPLLERYLSWDEQARVMKAMHEGAEAVQAARELDVRELPPARRHSLIFETFEALEPGQAFVLLNDHDPRPLYYQFQAERANTFTWEYQEQGPHVWRVRIGKTSLGG